MMTLEEAIQHCKEKANGSCACADDHRQLAEWLTELAERRKAEPKWIPCSERLPERLTGFYHHNSVNVLMSVRDTKRNETTTDFGHTVNDKWYSYLDDEFVSDSYFSRYKVVAWMPLPQPYKGETNG